MKILMTLMLPFIFLVTSSCGKKTKSDLKIELFPAQSVLVNAKAYSSCKDRLDFAQQTIVSPLKQSLSGWIAVFNKIKITYEPSETRYLNWWNIRMTFKGPQVSGGTFTCDFTADWDALVSADLDADWNSTTNIYRTANECKVICSGLTIADQYKNMTVTLRGELKVTAYSFTSEEDTQPKLIKASLPIKVTYDGAP
jgi:hypothetical protein